ncbi:MAG: type II secretion system protein [Candidatus Riflebacteria bacterium]|nr:type II secretion system protein [Candidatus Riflebacteria bacterium]
MNKRRGTTLLEIMSALLILAFAFLPLIGVIGTSSSDSDVANSQVFAQTTARNILDTLLEDVPFNSIIPAAGLVPDLDGTNPQNDIAEISNFGGFDRTGFLGMLGNSGGDNYARGNITDERGIVYKTRIYVFPIPVSNPLNKASEMAFTCLPRPIYENQVDANGQNIWYTYSDPYMPSNVLSPYHEDGNRVVQPATTTLGAYELGAEEGAAGNDRCVMKKILFKIFWQNRSGHERAIELFTMKANLD